MFVANETVFCGRRQGWERTPSPQVPTPLFLLHTSGAAACCWRASSSCCRRAKKKLGLSSKKKLEARALLLPPCSQPKPHQPSRGSCCGSALHLHPLLPCTPQIMCWRAEHNDSSVWHDDSSVSDVPCAAGSAAGWCAQQNDLRSAEHNDSSIHSTHGHTRKDRRTPLTHACESDGSLSRVRPEEVAAKVVMELSDAVPHAPILLSHATPSSSP
jgi:hypothetical protein